MRPCDAIVNVDKNPPPGVAHVRAELVAPYPLIARPGPCTRFVPGAGGLSRAAYHFLERRFVVPDRKADAEVTTVVDVE